MKLIDYKKNTSLDEKAEVHKAKLLCFFAYKEKNQSLFQIGEIVEMFVDAGYSKPNASRLKKNLINKKIFKEINKKLLFVTAAMQELEDEYNDFWSNNEEIESNSDLLDEAKFCQKRGFLDKLVKQINKTYSDNCYDATAVLMRRIFEIMLILTYQKFQIDQEIMLPDGSGYQMLSSIINNATNNTTIKLSRIKKEYNKFQKTGNFSAHNIKYNAIKKNIDEIKKDFRVMLEELYHKYGLM